MKYCNKEKIIVVFDGTTDRNRVAHIIKIHKILSDTFNYVIIITSRITPEAYANIRKNIDINSKYTILVLDSNYDEKRCFY